MVHRFGGAYESRGVGGGFHSQGLNPAVHCFLVPVKFFTQFVMLTHLT
jgi:hypothetical protein